MLKQIGARLGNDINQTRGTDIHFYAKSFLTRGINADDSPLMLKVILTHINVFDASRASTSTMLKRTFQLAS